jgi:uncharacterized tellurite resistance protein B-like protein
MKNDTKMLVKILIGVAWIDGKIQPEERKYLHQLAKENGVADDLEIHPLLYELRSVNSEECYQWVQEYLGDHPIPEECQHLIEAISGLIYSDGTIATEEAKLLTRLQILESGSDPSPSLHTKALTAIRKLYQHWVTQI